MVIHSSQNNKLNRKKRTLMAEHCTNCALLPVNSLTVSLFNFGSFLITAWSSFSRWLRTNNTCSRLPLLTVSLTTWKCHYWLSFGMMVTSPKATGSCTIRWDENKGQRAEKSVFLIGFNLNQSNLLNLCNNCIVVVWFF